MEGVYLFFLPFNLFQPFFFALTQVLSGGSKVLMSPLCWLHLILPPLVAN